MNMYIIFILAAHSERSPLHCIGMRLINLINSHTPNPPWDKQNPCRIVSIFDIYIDMSKKIDGKQDGFISLFPQLPN